MSKMKSLFQAKSIAFLIFVLIMTAVSLTGCITLVPPTTTTTATTSTVLSITATTTTPTEVIDPTWTPTFSGNNEALPNIADVVAKVKPSVVSINVQVPYQGFFGTSVEEGSGSGWVLDDSGIIVTNNHVIEGATSITVTLDDGRVISVDTGSVYTDATNDLAILKVKADNLTALEVGDSTSMRVGDWVVAIGNSLGLGVRATVGIVSQLDVSLQVENNITLYNLIDTSAVINPGNSGGPLVNLAGQVVGITSAKIVATGAEATGFAISMEEAAPIIQELINNGYVVRPFLGVQGLITMDEAVANYYRIDMHEGVLVRGVMDGTPAQITGLQAGDIITKIDGQTVKTFEELTRILYKSAIGEPMEMSYWRDGREIDTQIVPAESPPPSFG